MEVTSISVVIHFNTLVQLNTALVCQAEGRFVPNNGGTDGEVLPVRLPSAWVCQAVVVTTPCSRHVLMSSLGFGVQHCGQCNKTKKIDMEICGDFLTVNTKFPLLAELSNLLTHPPIFTGTNEGT